MNFNAEQEARHIVSWIQNWFSNKGAGTTAVIGISGGKDSTIAAALTAKALGPDRVLGVLIPNGHQADLDDAKRVVRTLGICGTIVNIGGGHAVPFDTQGKIFRSAVQFSKGVALYMFFGVQGQACRDIA